MDAPKVLSEVSLSSQRYLLRAIKKYVSMCWEVFRIMALSACCPPTIPPDEIPSSFSVGALSWLALIL